MTQEKSAQAVADEIIDEFSFFEEWSDRYQHLIDQGRRLPPIKDEWRDEAHRLTGCQSVVYFGVETDAAASDAAIVQGLIALLLRVYSQRMPKEILAISPDFITKIGLDRHLSPTRKNGLAHMVQAIRDAAQAASSTSQN